MCIENAEKSIQKSLENIFSQTLQEIELICINNGSTDDSGEILSRYSSKESRLLSLTQERQSLGMARNNALSLAQGKYVYYIDVKDGISRDLLSTLYQIAEKENCDILLNSYSQVINENQIKIIPVNISEISKEGKIETSPAPQGRIANEKFYSSILIEDYPLWNILYRREFLIENQLKIPALGSWEDKGFLINIINSSPKIFNVNYPKYIRFPRQEANRKHKSSEVFKIINYIKESIQSHPEDEMIKQAYLYFRNQSLYEGNKELKKEEKKEYNQGVSKILTRKEYNAYLEQTEGVRIIDLKYLRIKIPNKKRVRRGDRTTKKDYCYKKHI